MEEDILFCKTNNVNGIVFGVLTSENEIDLEICKRIIECAKPMAVTFHRAIDSCKDLHSSFQTLINLGVDHVLTSGGPGSAKENIPTLIALQNEFGDQIKIMPGGGIRSSNLGEILKTHCSEFHSAALVQGDEMADAEEIRRLKKLLT